MIDDRKRMEEGLIYDPSAKDILKHCILVFAWVLNQTHCDTCYRGLDWHTCGHEG